MKMKVGKVEMSLSQISGERGLPRLRVDKRNSQQQKTADSTTLKIYISLLQMSCN